MSQQFGIKEVLNYTVKDFITKKPVFFVDYASEVDIKTTAKRLDLRGGQGDYKLMGFDYDKDMTCETTLPLVDLTILSSLTDGEETIGQIQVPKRQLRNADESNSITLSHLPVDGTLQVYLLEGVRDLGAEQTLAESAVAAIPATGVFSFSGGTSDGDTVTIGSNVYEFKVSGTPVAGHILVDISGGATATASATALISAIVGDTTAVVHAIAGSTTSKVNITAVVAGISGNAIATTTTMALNGSFISTTLTGGVAATVAANGYVISGSTLTFNSTVAPFHTKFMVWYEYLTSSTSSSTQMTFAADKFPQYVSITGEGLMVDQVTGDSYIEIFSINKAKVRNTFDITTSPSKATELKLTYDLYCDDIFNYDTNTIDRTYMNMFKIDDEE